MTRPWTARWRPCTTLLRPSSARRADGGRRAPAPPPPRAPRRPAAPPPPSPPPPAPPPPPRRRPPPPPPPPPPAPRVARWLGDIRTYFPSSVVQIMQRDAIDRLNLTALLLEPELLESIEPDVHLVGTLLSLKGVMPEATRLTAREVVRRVVEQVE